MIKLSKIGAVSVLLFIIAIIYVSWSQIALYKYRKALEIEKTRVYNIAEHLELWKEVSIKHNGYLDVENLKKYPSNIEVTQVDRKELLMPDDEKLYVMYYQKVGFERENELKRYFSDQVLNNYFYVITDSNGKIKEMFWDKP